MKITFANQQNMNIDNLHFKESVLQEINTPPAASMSITKLGFFVIALLFISFAYEMPLVNLTRFDRLNPRLFDVAAILLGIYWLIAGRRHGWKLRLRLPVVWPWFWVTFFFGVATMFSILWIPSTTYLYSLYYFIKYLETMMVVLVFASIPFKEEDKRKLLWVALLGGVWVSFYALLQYVGIVSTLRLLPTGTEVNMFKQGLYSTLGVTYFHLGMFGVLSYLVGFALFTSTKFGIGKISALAFTLFCFIPSIISGSKAGLLGLGISMSLILLQREYRKRIGAYFLVLLVVLIGFQFYANSVARERLIEGSGGTPIQRLKAGFRTLEEVYQFNGPKLLIVGGGFYVVPKKSTYGSKPKYRIGYGNHNIFLFPLEQAGVGAFIASICLWFSIYRALGKKIRSAAKKSFDGVFASSMKIFFVTLMLVGIAGQVFYLGFGTEHFTVYQLLLFILATSTASLPKSKSSVHYEDK